MLGILQVLPCAVLPFLPDMYCYRYTNDFFPVSGTEQQKTILLGVLLAYYTDFRTVSRIGAFLQGINVILQSPEMFTHFLRARPLLFQIKLFLVAFLPQHVL